MATRLGLTSFGGPVAHLGYFRQEYVVRRRWIDDAAYADLVALCQFLPGPASSQVGIAIGVTRAGLPGGPAAWLGFTLPLAAALVAFAYGIRAFDISGAGWLHGLKIAAVAVVAQAVAGMARMLTPDRQRQTIGVLAAVAALLWPAAITQVAVILATGLVGWRLLPAAGNSPARPMAAPIGRRLAFAAWGALAVLLAGLPLLRQAHLWQGVAVADSFFRSGALIFGGGHVVLPLLQAEVVRPGWVSADQFVAGYGAAQAVPRPAVHLCRLPGRGAAARPQRPRRRGPGSGGDLPPLVPLHHRRAALLGRPPGPERLPRGAARHQRRGGGAAAGGAVQPRPALLGKL